MADLAALVAAGATVIGLQEASDRTIALTTFAAAHHGWAIYRPNLPGGKAVPILYDARVWQLVRSWSTLAVDARFVGPGAGPSTSKPKRINVVELRGPDGVVRRFACTHFIASATRPARRYWRRRRHYAIHAAALVKLITAADAVPAVVLTDANAQRDDKVTEPIRATGITGWTTLPTHGTRAIDHVLGVGGDRETVELSSDHHAVIAPL